jgi:hypothetical protein
MTAEIALGSLHPHRPYATPSHMHTVVHWLSDKAYYQAFFWVLIDLIVELLGLIIKPFDNQTES